MSEDHCPFLLKEKARIETCGGEVINGRVNGKLAMSRAIGDFSYKGQKPPHNASYQWYLMNHMVTSLPDITCYSRSDDIKFIIIACDGIWDCLSSEQINNLYYKKIINKYKKYDIDHL